MDKIRKKKRESAYALHKIELGEMYRHHKINANFEAYLAWGMLVLMYRELMLRKA